MEADEEAEDAKEEAAEAQRKCLEVKVIIRVSVSRPLTRSRSPILPVLPTLYCASEAQQHVQRLPNPNPSP